MTSISISVGNFDTTEWLKVLAWAIQQPLYVSLENMNLNFIQLVSIKISVVVEAEGSWERGRRRRSWERGIKGKEILGLL